MISLNYRDPSPIYEQIKQKVKKLIVTGVLQKDEKLPSVRALATDLAINPNTIQKAYKELENEGYLYSVPGKGAFVRGAVEVDERRKKELMQQMKEIAEELRFMGVSRGELLELLGEEEA